MEKISKWIINGLFIKKNHVYPLDRFFEKLMNHENFFILHIVSRMNTIILDVAIV